MEFTQEHTSSHRSVEALRALFGRQFLGGFDVRLWDGRELHSSTPERRFTLVLNEASALRTAFAPPIERSFGAAFGAGLIDVEGDLAEALRLLTRARDRRNALQNARLAMLILTAPKNGKLALEGAHLKGAPHSRERDKAAIEFHYDHPIAFYRSFLDPALVYSCAYFDDGVDSIEEAQARKLDYVLAKLRVEPGMSLLDIGCGNGSLVIRAAGRGIKACGITLSRVQHEEANRRINELGLSDFAKVELRDYRDLGKRQLFDRIASIGMVEHVGKTKLAEYFRCAFKALKPGGLFLNHGIGEQSPRRNRPRNPFIDSFVFPDGDLIPVGDMLGVAERNGFEVRDVENLREHYARTLHAWVANLERNSQEAISAAGIATYRIWRLYMAASAVSFENASIAVFQSLLAKPDELGRVSIPRTRNDLYSQPEALGEVEPRRTAVTGAIAPRGTSSSKDRNRVID